MAGLLAERIRGDLIDQYRVDQRPDVPGLTSSTEDGEHYAERFDSRGIATNVPATPVTLYGVWSIPKPLTALASVQLLEERDTLG